VGAFGEEFSFEQQLSDNIVSNVTIDDNTINMAGTGPNGWTNFGGVILRGGFEDTNNNLTNVEISSNEVISPVPGLQLQGGFFAPTTHNRVSHVEISCNSLAGPTATAGSGVKWINLGGGTDGANSNSIQDISLADNMVSGIQNDFSSFPNVTPHSSSNTISLLTVLSHYQLMVGQNEYGVTVATNSSISNLGFNQSSKSLTFTFDGPSTGSKGYLNATLPKTLLSGTFVATVSGNPVGFKLAQNSTDYFLYTTYPVGTPTLQVAVANPVTTTTTSTTSSMSSSSSVFTTTRSTTLGLLTSSSATSTSSLQTTSMGGGGIPEFPVQVLGVSGLVIAIVLSYMVVRRRVPPQ
jgi:hypothetical protein